MKKFNLVISAPSTVQLNEEFPKEYELLTVPELRKEVIKAVRSYGKTTVTALTFHWWGSNYILRVEFL